MSDNSDPSQKRTNRLSPEELARDVLSRLQGTPRQRTEGRRRIDIVTVSRIAIAIGIVLIGGGAAFALSWISSLRGYQTTGVVAGETPLFGCPGEPELGVLFTGETVQVVGRTGDGAYLVVRDDRGPGNLAYAPVGSVTAVVGPEQLEVRSCEPRSSAEVAAMVQTSTTGASTTTAIIPDSVSTTVATSTTSTTGTVDTGRPPGRGVTPGPGATTSTTPLGPSPSQPTTTRAPGAPAPTTTTTRPRATTTTTSATTTSTMAAPTTTSTVTTTTTEVTTTTQVTTTTTEVTTTTVGETTPTG